MVGISPHGQGEETTFAQIVAEELDADWQKIKTEWVPADAKYGNPNFGGQQLTGLALGAHHQDCAAIGSQLLGELGRLLEHRQGFFQVDDVDLVAMAENEGGHLGVPEAGLVAKVDTGFQHFTHGDGHVVAPKVGSEILSDNHGRPENGRM